MSENNENKHFRILSLDGGGSKGVYTIGVLREVSARIKTPFFQYFDLIYGTSTGAIIGSLLALGKDISEVEEIYFKHIPEIMKHKCRDDRSAALRLAAKEIFGELDFSNFKTHVGLVATNYESERPMIFKLSKGQSFGMQGTFKPGFGCSIADAVVASASAFPFFERVVVDTENQGSMELMDGGYVANNPTLFAITEALNPFNVQRNQIRVLSVGVGHYCEPQRNLYSRLLFSIWPFQMIQKLFASNTNTIETLRKLGFADVSCVRIDESYPDAKYSTDLLEADVEKLKKILVLGRNSYSEKEHEFASVFSI